MARLFVSHSSKDNVYAHAFHTWLAGNGWADEDVFIDLHGIAAGERWRDRLRKANHQCEAVILLASPDALDSKECIREINLAEDQGKEIIVAIIRDLEKTDPRLSRFSDRQFVALNLFPQDYITPLEYDGRSYRIAFNPIELGKIRTRLDELGIGPERFPWPPKGRTNAEPYPGLSAMTEDDAGIFFGRDADIMRVLSEIRLMRRRGTPRVMVIEATSGAGKSSFLRAGLWPRLKRDPDFLPMAILRPAQGIVTGPEGLGRRTSPLFASFNTVKAPGAINATVVGADANAARLALQGVFAEATMLAMQARGPGSLNGRQPAALIAIDQGEELFAAENEAESRRFLELMAGLLNSPPSGIDPYLIIAIRADSVQSLLYQVSRLKLETPKAIYLPPLSPAAYRDIILKPAEIYSSKVRRVAIEPALADALVNEATGADALPLLAFTLSELFKNFSAEGNLTLARYRQMGGISGSIARALGSALTIAGPKGTADHLKRLILPGLATWDPEADQGKGAAKRLVASAARLTEGSDADLGVLANALVHARLLARGGDTLEVAHEALLRQPPICDWLAEDREFLIWRDRLSRERDSYERNQRDLLADRELQIALSWLAQRREHDIAAQDASFIRASAKRDELRKKEEREKEDSRQAAELKATLEREKAAQQIAVASRRIAQRTRAGLVAALTFALTAGALGVYAYIKEMAASAEANRALEAQRIAEVATKDADAARQQAVQSAYTIVETTANLSNEYQIPAAATQILIGSSDRALRLLEETDVAPPLLRHRQAITLIALSESFMIVGKAEPWLKNAERGLQLLEGLAHEQPEDDELARDVLRARLHVGDAQLATGSSAAAIATYRNALSSISERGAGGRSESRYLRDIARLNTRIGSALSREDPKEALSSITQGRVILEALLASNPNDDDIKRDLADAVAVLGVGRGIIPIDNALSNQQLAIELRKQLIERQPNNLAHLGTLADAYKAVGEIQRTRGVDAEALEALESAVRTRKTLVARDPTHALWAYQLSTAYNELGRLEQKRELFDQALGNFEAGLAIRLKSIAGDPNNIEWLRDLSWSYAYIGEVKEAQGKHDAALTSYKRSLEIRQKLTNIDAKSPRYRRDYGWASIYVGNTLLSKSDYAAAIASHRAAETVFLSISAEQPQNTLFARDLAMARRFLGQSLAGAGFICEALGKLGEASADMARLVILDRQQADWKRDLDYVGGHIERLRRMRDDWSVSCPPTASSHNAN